MSVKSCALTPATGASAPVKRSRVVKKRASWVRLSARFDITGARWVKNDGATWTAWLRSGPRSVSALPKPVRLSCSAIRVGRSKILNTSSICTGTLVWLTGMVSPSSRNFVVDLPRVSEVRPSADRGRTSTVESAGSLPVFSALDKKTGKLPADSTVEVRPRSALGLKYSS